MDTIGKTLWVPARELCRGTTMYWTGKDLRPRWGIIKDIDPSSRHVLPRHITIDVAPGHKTWEQTLTVDYDTIILTILNPNDCLPKLGKVLPPARPARTR